METESVYICAWLTFRRMKKKWPFFVKCICIWIGTCMECILVLVGFFFFVKLNILPSLVVVSSVNFLYRLTPFAPENWCFHYGQKPNNGQNDIGFNHHLSLRCRLHSKLLLSPSRSRFSALGSLVQLIVAQYRRQRLKSLIFRIRLVAIFSNFNHSFPSNRFWIVCVMPWHGMA